MKRSFYYAVYKPLNFQESIINPQEVELPFDHSVNCQEIFDGNYLYLHVRYFPRADLTIKLWKMKLVKRYTANKAYAYAFISIGDAFTMSNEDARVLAAKIYTYIEKHNNLPRLKRFLCTKRFSNGTYSRTYSNIIGGQKYKAPNIVSDEQIEGVFEIDNSSDRYDYRIVGNLYLRVRENKASIKKTFIYVLKNRICTLGIFPKMNLEEAKLLYQKIVFELEKKPSEKIDLEKVKKVILEYYKNSNLMFPINTIRNKFPSNFEIENKLKRRAQKNKNKVEIKSLLEELSLMTEKLSKNVSTISFEDAFLLWFANWEKTVKENTAIKIKHCINKYAELLFRYDLKELLDKKVIKHFLVGFKKIYPLNAERCFWYINAIVNEAVFYDYLDSNPLQPLVRPFLALQKKGYKIEHRKTLNHYSLEEEIHKIFKNQISYMAVHYRAAFEMMFYTLLRPGELLNIKKEQIITANDSIWRLSAYQTKTLEEFSIPLVGYGRELAEFLLDFGETKEIKNSEWLFPSVLRPSNHLPYASIYYTKNTMKMSSLDLHGIRSVGANFFAQNVDKIPFEVGQAALQHTYASKVHMAYDRTFLYKPRINAMKLWGDFLQEAIGKKDSVLYGYRSRKTAHCLRKGDLG